MSIILKGIDLPTNGETLIVGIYGDGNVSIEHSKPLVLAIDPNAEAIQIPKGHGRLIDASTETTVKSMSGEAMDVGMLLIALKQYVPTIIGAEE